MQRPNRTHLQILSIRRDDNRWTHHPGRRWVRLRNDPGKPALAQSISNSCRRPIIQSGYTSFPPAYPLLHVDALNTELAKASPLGNVDPVVYVASGGGDMPDGSACCHIQVGEMRMLVSVSGDGECSLVPLPLAGMKRTRGTASIALCPADCCCSGPLDRLCIPTSFSRNPPRLLWDGQRRDAQR